MDWGSEYGPKYKEKDWTRRDLRGVQIYEEEWTGGDWGRLEEWVWVEHGPKYKEKDWTKSDLRGVQIYEEEWTGWVNTV